MSVTVSHMPGEHSEEVLSYCTSPILERTETLVGKFAKIVQSVQIQRRELLPYLYGSCTLKTSSE